MEDFFKAVEKRHSVYSISEYVHISDDEIKKIIDTAILNSPTYFNGQSSRVVLLLGNHSKRLWEIVFQKVKPLVAEHEIEGTKQKIDAFAAAYGTVLYFDDTSVTSHFIADYPLYKDNFPVWAEQQNGMLQYIIWTALSEKDLGASLQHYNPLIDDDVKKEWNIPDSWRLIAQMPFGKIVDAPEKKEAMPLDQRIIVIK